MSIGTFDAFTAARMGIYSAQHGLRVTGNNISNINTDRYTRQRADQVSFKTGAADHYASWMDNHVGNGSFVTGISQIRDPFLDIRYRTTTTDTYYYDSKLAGLRDIAAILDEVGKGENKGDGLIYAQLQDLAEKLRAFSADPTNSNDGLVRESASALASLFRTYAGKLDELFENAKTDFNNSITKTNEILTNIRDLNKSIREAEIHGDMALEMRDERNRQIDELAKYMSIRVEYSYEDVGAGLQVEKLTIYMDNSNPDPSVTTDSSMLVDGVYATQLSIPKQKPLANTYDTSDPKYAYLKDYLYLKSVTAEEAEALGYDTADLINALDKDGFEISDRYYVGTNFVDDADKVENDNFTVQLGKLLDYKGRVWENTETTWTEMTGDNLPAKAKYVYSLTIDQDVLDALEDGDDILKDGDTIYTAGENGDISLAAAKNPDKLLAFIAKKLNSSEKYADYNVTVSKTDAGYDLVFTAKKPGAVGDPDAVAAGAPAAQPPEPLGTGSWLTGIKLAEEAAGSVPDDAGTTVDAYGNETTIGYVEVEGKWYRVEMVTEHTREIALDDNDLHGILQAQREMLTEEGEFASQKDVDIDENAADKRGIPYYIKSLDLLAQKFAEAYNALNQGYRTDQKGNYLTEDNKRIEMADGGFLNKNELTKAQLEEILGAGDYTTPFEGKLTETQQDALKKGETDLGYITLKDGTMVTYDADADEFVTINVDAYAKDQGAYYMHGVLFSNSNSGDYVDDPPINAHNIDISFSWSHGLTNLIPKFEVLFPDENDPDGMEHSTQNTNADHMLALLDKSLTYEASQLHDSEDSLPKTLFEGSFNDFLSNMMAVEASDERITSVQFSTSDLMLTDLDYSREGVSGVDLNDEAMNMLTYQKAMNAAMRMMTAVDEALERLINNTGIAGR